MNNESLSKNDKIDFQIADHLMEAEQITAAEIARRTGGISQRGELLPRRQRSACSAHSRLFDSNIGDSRKGGE